MPLDPRSWPITVKVPLAVAALMVLVAAVLSERVLSHLAATQERHLRELVEGYLDGLSSAVAPSILREDTWEIFDAIMRAQELNKGLRPIEAIVATASGQVLAASNPRQHAVGTMYPGADSDPEGFRFDPGADTAGAVRELSYPGRVVARIYATFDTSHLAAERRDVLTTLVLTNGGLTLLLAAGGWLFVARMMRPVRVLSDRLWDPSAGARLIPENAIARERGEFRQLFTAYNALVQSMSEREDLAKRLAEERRLADLGRLASALAHEINNPLGGLFNALATIKSHGHLAAVRGNAVGLLERGLVGIREVVRTSLALYRSDREPRRLRAADIEDLKLLVAAEARRRSITVVTRNELAGELPLPSTPLRQSLLNLLLNAVAAAPAGSEVQIAATASESAFAFVVTDSGPGLPDAASRLLAGPTPAPPLDGGGLGLWATRRLVDEIGGTIEVAHPPNGGTAVGIVIRRQEELSHVA